MQIGIRASETSAEVRDTETPMSDPNADDVNSPIRTVSFTDLAQEFHVGLVWLRAQGVPPRDGSRFSTYADIVQEIAAVSSIASDAELAQRYDEYSDVLYEVSDFIRIYRSFSSYPPNGDLRQRLQRLMGGPARVRDEVSDDPRSVLARNTGLELAIAAVFADAGFQPTFSGAADTTIADGNRKIFIEAKRVRSERKIDANLRRAIEQCELRINNSGSKVASGIAVLDFSVIANPDGKISYHADPAEAFATLRRAVGTFVQEFVTPISLEKHPRILGIMVRYAGKIATAGRLLSDAQQLGFNISGSLDAQRAETLRRITDALELRINR